MYIPEPFAVTDEADLSALMASLRLGCLVTHDEGGLHASHLPMVYDPERHVLAGHLARANPHSARLADGGEALAIFQGVEAYISPGWYPSKREHGKAVPTWNYEAVHVHGRLSTRGDEAWLLAHLAALTGRFEAGRPEPWGLGDAPEGFIPTLARGILGVEVAVERIEAKRKLSQNRPAADQLGVIAGLEQSEAPSDRAMAQAMRALSGVE